MNARIELVKTIDVAQIRCAEIFNPDLTVLANLSEKFNKKELDIFLQSLDFEYSLESSPAISGIIWMNDGSWYDRYFSYEEEFWQRHEFPKIPKRLLEDD